MPASLTMAPWLLLALGAAALVGVTSAAVQLAGIAPLGVGSLITGLALGLVLTVIARLGNLRPCRTIWGIVVVCSLATVAAEHAWFYRHYRQQWHGLRLETPALAIFRPEEHPEPLLEYLADEATPQQIVYWITDAVLVTAATVGTVVVLNRRE